MFVTIRAKLIGLIFLSLLFTALVGGYAYYSNVELAKQFAESRGKLESINAFLQGGAGQDAIRADVLQILRASRNADTAAYREAVADLSAHLKLLAGKAANSGLTGKPLQSLAAIAADTANYAKAAQNIAVLAQTDIASADEQYAAFSEAYKKLQADQSAMNNSIAGETEDLRNSANAAALRSGNTVLAVLGGAAVLLWLFLYAIYRRVTGSLNRLRQAISKVESGHYEVRVNLRSGDEIGTLARAFDKLIDERISVLKSSAADNERINNSVIGLFGAMGALAEKDLTVRAPVTEDIIGTLGDAINQLTDVTATVLHHVTKVAGVVEDASERMKKQSDVVNEMAKEEDVIVVRLISNLETAMASIGEVAIFARDSNRAAAEATKSTESAMQTVQATLVGMNAIRETISEMEKRIKRLGERSQEISQIVNLINTISERTHVLSLNAAMQAAMAGEAGRGFAVVAEEVQRLAENSRQATGQIANLVQNIQVETNDTIATVNKTIEQVVKESDLAHSAGERMRETHEATARLVRLVATIATSSAEQTKIAVVLRAAADEIAQFTEKTAEQLVAQNQSAASLVSASQKLVGAISVFKLPPMES